MTSKVLDSLIQDLFDGCIEPNGLQHLEAELVSNPQSLALYLDFVDLDCLLKFQSVIDKELENPLQFQVEEVPTRRRSVVVAAVLSLAAVLIFAGVMLRFLFVGKDPAFRVSNNSTYTLTDSGGHAIREEGSLPKGSRLKLEQGSVEMTFGSGVRGVIVAPADLTLQDYGRLFLKQGTAWFHGPPNASGFQVLTPQMVVVDLGTEFGILSRDGHTDEVHVLKGRVNAGSSLGSRMTETLAAGQARRIDAIGDLVSIPLAAGCFVETLPKKLPSLRCSFDEIEGNQLVTSGAFPSAENVKATLIQTDTEPRLVPGKFGQALSLNGRGDYVLSDWSGFPGNRPRTVSFWVRMPSTGDYRPLLCGIVGWGMDDPKANTKWKIRAVQKTRGGAACIRLSWGVTWLDGSTPLNDGQWHHVVVATTGKTLPSGLPDGHLYVDGRPEQSHYDGAENLTTSPPMDTDTTPPKAVPMIIGRSLTASNGVLSYFEGEIDELEIFDGYLSEEDVRMLPTP